MALALITAAASHWVMRPASRRKEMHCCAVVLVYMVAGAMRRTMASTTQGKKAPCRAGTADVRARRRERREKQAGLRA